MEAQEERPVHSHTTPSPGALTGLRVIELADEQAEYCGLAWARTLGPSRRVASRF